MAMVERRFPEAPGSLTSFGYPVTRQQAREALADIVEHRLASFGRYQDAMVTGQPFVYHSRLSAVLNLHLLDPREAIDAAYQAYQDGSAPLNSVEGFVRQILGWREYVRGIYWLKMPGYADLNALDARLPMPAFMWTGETEMNCIRQSVGQLIEHAYAHHIQRLMVLGLFAMLLGVRPYAVHQWHMSMYADAIDWASLPNVLGMSQYGDGGIVGSKPYAASGNYISRMSDYCRGCRYDPRQAIGERACPFTTLYWNFLERNRDKIGGNRRMRLQLNNLARKDHADHRAISKRAETLRASFTRQTYL
jgi:deoxyribodipyrimidine photolyase-related protein